ncbi:hypothetical protein DUNSADRAFT_2836 [Dunaliella salina]|uniref:Protein LOW PSII ACCUMULATION 1, chloroplastic n=1 Tax=Dunaliella salina TaxID=3046 RepID=A0ABQ7GV02_DUNSA|nr:hypothetical protein DUNSADRAFT_2836 [Dunaliella salina]|eukprot:KAF5838442.1 hypothetical protein DUNSADRAFT_2836 [Dunaliella salina]
MLIRRNPILRSTSRNTPNIDAAVGKVSRASCNKVVCFPRNTLHLRTHLCHAEPEKGAYKPPSMSDPNGQVRLRSEVEAPWRAVRFALFGFSAVSAGIGLLVNLPQLIGALGGARNAFGVEEIGTNIGINAAVVAVCAFLLSRDLKARDKQMARLGREEALASCQVQLANGKRKSLAALRGFARIVVCAGTNAQVAAAMEAAAPYKDELIRRGVLVVPAPIFESPSSPTGEPLPPPGPEDLRWRAMPLQMDRWKEWFEKQLSVSDKAVPDRGLYLSLRKDGRVRSSGMGGPPWALLAAQLPPEEGVFKGFLDGMDGRV